MTVKTAPAKKPNAAQISRILGATEGLTKWEGGKKAGYKVSAVKNTGDVIDHSTELPHSFRFAFVQVTWESDSIMKLFRDLLMPEESKMALAEKALTDAGYAVVRRPLGDVTTLAVVSQEALDWRAAREERAANADELAEAMVPACDRVIGYQADMIAHDRRSGSIPRAQVVTQVARFLRNPEVDVLDRDEIADHCRWYDGVNAENIACGFRHKRLVMLIRAA